MKRRQLDRPRTQGIRFPDAPQAKRDSSAPLHVAARGRYRHLERVKDVGVALGESRGIWTASAPAALSAYIQAQAACRACGAETAEAVASVGDYIQAETGIADSTRSHHF
jgi:hypothetical protein